MYSKLLPGASCGAFSVLAAAMMVSACDIESSNNVPGVPPAGFYAAVAANQHSGESSIQVAAAMFADGQPINLYGGDVIEASTADESILLLDRGYFTGSYTASLDNASQQNSVHFEIVHEPLEARQRRWYPVDILYIDPGPGELFGGSADIVLPPAPEISSSPQAAVYSSINDQLDIQWTPLGAGDRIKIRSVVTCSDGSRTESYSTEVVADDTDDGIESVGIDQFIYDVTAAIPIEFVTDEVLAMMQELLDRLEGSVLGQALLNRLQVLNPITSSCEIRVFLFRQRPGSFANPATSGRVFGSRSAEFTVLYDPG